MKINAELEMLADEAYREFHSKLMPTVSKDKILGVRVPILRKYARSLFKERPDEAASFLGQLPHKFYEQDNLHAFLIEQISDFDAAMEHTEKFLPFIDNWATCDMFFPKIFLKNPDEMRKKAIAWINSEKPYVIRYGIGIAMRMFIEKASFDPEFPEIIGKMRSKEYYVNMMRAWFFATALAKQSEIILPYIENHVLDDKTHNMTIKKAVESFRIDEQMKEYLKTKRVPL